MKILITGTKIRGQNPYQICLLFRYRVYYRPVDRPLNCQTSSAAAAAAANPSSCQRWFWRIIPPVRRVVNPSLRCQPRQPLSWISANCMYSPSRHRLSGLSTVRCKAAVAASLQTIHRPAFVFDAYDAADPASTEPSDNGESFCWCPVAYRDTTNGTASAREWIPGRSKWRLQRAPVETILKLKQ